MSAKKVVFQPLLTIVISSKIYRILNLIFRKRAPLWTGNLTVKCDRIQAREWEPFANAIANDNSIHAILLYCELQSHSHSHQQQASTQPSRQIPSTKKQQQQQQPHQNRLNQQRVHPSASMSAHAGAQRGRCPAIQEVGTSLRVCRGLGGCLANSLALQSLKLVNLVFTHDNLACLSHGLAVTQSLAELRFVDCKMGDDGVAAIYPGLLENQSISVLQLDKCNLTDKSAVRVSKIIQHHALRRHTDNWQTGLRETGDGDNGQLEGDEEVDKQERESNRQAEGMVGKKQTGGLQRILLADNRIADEGAAALASALKLDLWMQELDLQSNYIGLEGGKALRDALLENVTLVALILKDNKISDISVLSEISSGVEMNADKKSQEFVSSGKRNETSMRRSNSKPATHRSALNNTSSGRPQTIARPIEQQPDVMTLLQQERALRESLENKVKTLLDENHTLRDSMVSVSTSQRGSGTSSSNGRVHEHPHPPQVTTHPYERSQSQLSIADLDTPILPSHYNNNTIRPHLDSPHSQSYNLRQSNFHPEMEDYAQYGSSSRGDNRRASLELEKQLESSRSSREATQDMDLIFFKSERSPTSSRYSHHQPHSHRSYHGHVHGHDNEEDEMALERLEDSFKNLNNLLSRLESENLFSRSSGLRMTRK